MQYYIFTVRGSHYHLRITLFPLKIYLRLVLVWKVFALEHHHQNVFSVCFLDLLGSAVQRHQSIIKCLLIV